MELYHLKTFTIVAEEGHLTRAADRLFTSQPAISAHIKALEEELGITLFQRTPKGMKLTLEGEKLLPHAQQALAAAGDFLQQARSMQDELVGHLSIGLNNDAEFLRLPALQQQLSRHYPRLELQFLGGMTQTNIPNVRIGKFDGAFISGDCADSRFEILALSEVELRVTAPVAWQPQLQDCSIENLARHPWVYTSQDCAYFYVMQALFKAHSCHPEKTLISDQEDAVRSMIKAGVGIGILRADEAEQGAAAGDFYLLPIELPKVSLDFIYLKTRANDPVISALRKELLSTWGIEHSESQMKVG